MNEKDLDLALAYIKDKKVRKENYHIIDNMYETYFITQGDSLVQRMTCTIILYLSDFRKKLLGRSIGRITGQVKRLENESAFCHPADDKMRARIANAKHNAIQKFDKAYVGAMIAQHRIANSDKKPAPRKIEYRADMTVTIPVYKPTTMIYKIHRANRIK
ncbi:MAG: hypothetical protein FWG39_01455 [Alphaproteobacteria bacterium]|nr:hypothetical protein [Alphaproteobacteria bacterium]